MCNNLEMEAPSNFTEKQTVCHPIEENGNSNVLIDRPTLIISTLPSRICAFSATETIVDDLDNDINNTKNIVIDHVSTVMIHASHTLDLNESLINPTTKHHKYQQQQHQNLSIVNTHVRSVDLPSLRLTTPDEQIKNESKILLLNHNSKNKSNDFYSPIDNKVNELQLDAVELSRGKCDADTYYICPERRIINATKDLHRTQNQRHMLHLRTFDDEMNSNHQNNQNHTQYYNNTCTVIDVDDEKYSPKIVSGAESLHRSDSELLQPLAIIAQPQEDSRDSSSQILSSELGVIETGGENSLETGSYQTLSSVVNEERISPEAFSPNSAYATLTPLQPLPPISTMSEKFAYGGHITGVNSVINNNVTNDQGGGESQRDNINIENHESDYEISSSYVVIPIGKEHTIEHIHRPSARHHTRHDLDSLSLSSLNSENSPFSAYDKLPTLTPHSFITSPMKILSGVGTNCDLPEDRHSPVSDCAAPHSPQLNYRCSNNISVEPLPLSHISFNSSFRQQKLREFHSTLLKTELSSEVNSQNSVEPLSPCNINEAGEVLLTEYESPFENHNRHNHDIFVNSKECSSSSICNIISKNCTDSSNLHLKVNSCLEINHSANKKGRICALSQKVLKVPIPITSNSSPKLNLDVTVDTESKNPIDSMLKSAQTKFLHTSKNSSQVDISTGITTIIKLGDKNVPNVVKTLNRQNVINIAYQSPHSSDHCDRDVRQSFIPKENIHSKIKSQVNQLGSIFHNNNNNNNCDIEEINTTELAQRISAELKRYSIPQAVFAQRVLCRSQGTLSDLLRNPKPWSKLKSGRETFRRMLKWLQEPEFQRMSALRIFAAQTTQRSLNIITTKTVTTSNKNKNNNGKGNKTNSNKTYKHNNYQLQRDPKNSNNNDNCCNNDDDDNNNNYNNYNNNNDNNNNEERIYKDYEGNSSSSLIILSAMDICSRKDQPPQIQHMPQPKKPRLVFTDLQRRTLQAIFKETKRPSKEMQVTIARQLGLEPTTVGNFFMNARRRSMDKWREDDSSGSKKVASDQHQSLQQFNYKHSSGRNMSQKQRQHFHLPCLSLTDITHHHPLEFNNEPDEVDLNLDSDEFPLSKVRDDGAHKIEDDDLL